MRRLPNSKRPDASEPGWVKFSFNGQVFSAKAGEPVAAALLAGGVRTIRRQVGSGQPRGIYCAIGHCFDCVATIDGVPGRRTCLTPVEDAMEVASDAS